MKLKWIWIGLIVFLLVGAAGSAFAGGNAESKTIVFIPKSTSATFYLFLVKGAQDKAKELGYKVDFLGPATEADVAAQVDFVRSIVKKAPGRHPPGSARLEGADPARGGSHESRCAGGHGGLRNRQRRSRCERHH